MNLLQYSTATHDYLRDCVWNVRQYAVNTSNSHIWPRTCKIMNRASRGQILRHDRTKTWKRNLLFCFFFALFLLRFCFLLFAFFLLHFCFASFLLFFCFFCFFFQMGVKRVSKLCFIRVVLYVHTYLPLSPTIIGSDRVDSIVDHRSRSIIASR